MSTDITVHSSKYQVEDRSWLIGQHGVDVTPGITLDISKFSRNGTGEVQKITVSGTDPFAVTLLGTPTDPIDDQATAADVRAALEAIVGVGKVAVAGSAGGPYTVTFAPELGDVAQMTATGATVSTTTAGATAHYPNGYIPSGIVLGQISASKLYGPYDNGANDGRETAAGLLFSSVRAIDTATGNPLATVGGAKFVHGLVNEAKLPANSGIDAAAKTDLKLIAWL
nr:head decoration protein [Mycobacterium sp. UM_NZ2]